MRRVVMDNLGCVCITGSAVPPFARGGKRFGELVSVRRIACPLAAGPGGSPLRCRDRGRIPAHVRAGPAGAEPKWTCVDHPSHTAGIRGYISSDVKP